MEEVAFTKVHHGVSGTNYDGKIKEEKWDSSINVTKKKDNFIKLFLITQLKKWQKYSFNLLK